MPGSLDIEAGFHTHDPRQKMKLITKRKHDGKVEAGEDVRSKKQHTGPNTTQIPRSLPLEPHEAVLTELRGKYELLPLSVVSSSKIEQRVSKVLAHLGRFHPTDLAVKPGVVLLHARASEASKMITMAEVVRRRVGEQKQKWYQYNRVYEVETAAYQEDIPSTIEDTVLGNAGGANGEDGDISGEEDDFEIMEGHFRDAVIPSNKLTTKTYMAIFLSRVPIPELKSKVFITAQSNEASIDGQRRKNQGVV